MTGVLIFGSYRHGLPVARSLDLAGMRVVYAYESRRPPASYSRHVHELWQHADPDSKPERFLEQLTALCTEQPELRCIFPIGEREMRWFLELQDRLPDTSRLLMADANSVRTCLDKAGITSVVDALAIPQPKSEVASTPAEALAAAEAVGFPCVAKMVDSRSLLLGKKAIIYDDRQALERDFLTWPVAGEPVLFQTYVSGARLNLYFFAWRGRLVAVGQTQTLRTDRMDGTGLSVCGITVTPDEQTVEYGRAIVEYLNYSGPGCMQFLVDASGSAVFLEHNPRMGAAVQSVYRAGFDLPRMVADFALGKGEVPESPHYPCRTGVRFAWTTGDLFGLTKAVRKHDIGVAGLARATGTLILDGLRSPIHLMWDWRDPKPALARLAKPLVSRRSAKPDTRAADEEAAEGATSDPVASDRGSASF